MLLEKIMQPSALKVIDCLYRHDVIDINVIMKDTGLCKNWCINFLQRLREDGIVKKTGNTRYTRYSLTPLARAEYEALTQFNGK